MCLLLLSCSYLLSSSFMVTVVVVKQPSVLLGCKAYSVATIKDSSCSNIRSFLVLTVTEVVVVLAGNVTDVGEA